MNQEKEIQLICLCFFFLVLVSVVLFFGILRSFSLPRTVNFSYVSVNTPDTAQVYRLVIKQEGTTKTQFGIRIQVPLNKIQEGGFHAVRLHL